MENLDEIFRPVLENYLPKFVFQMHCTLGVIPSYSAHDHRCLHSHLPIGGLAWVRDLDMYIR